MGRFGKSPKAGRSGPISLALDKNLAPSTWRDETDLAVALLCPESRPKLLAFQSERKTVLPTTRLAASLGQCASQSCVLLSAFGPQL